MTTFFANTISPIILNGLIGWWRMDEGTGNVAQDSSIFHNTGSVIASPIWSPGLFNGKCLKFNSTTQFIDLGTPQKLELYTGFSWSAWFMGATATAASQFVLAKDFSTGNRGFGMGLNATPGKFKVEVGGTTFLGATGPSLTGSVWQHAVVTNTGSTWNAYINGTFLGTFTKIVPSANTTAHWYIGGRQYVGNFDGFGGYIDNVRIYNRVLTPKEISLLYQSNS